jgi:zinc and cadmium transporter
MPLIWALLVGLGIVAAVVAGAAIVLLLMKARAAAISGLLSFATGTLLGAALLGLLPEAVEGMSTSAAGGVVLLGIAVFFVLERWVLWRHCHDVDCTMHTSAGYLILVGDALHNVVDGLALGAAFLADPWLGVAVGLAVFAHEVPQEVGDFALLLDGGLSASRALAYNLLSAATIFPGIVAGYLIAGAIEPAMPIILAVTAGGFLYVALADLVPHLHRREHPSTLSAQLLLLMAGVVVIAVAGQLGH